MFGVNLALTRVNLLSQKDLHDLPFNGPIIIGITIGIFLFFYLGLLTLHPKTLKKVTTVSHVELLKTY